MNFLNENKDWLFSGIGAAVFVTFVGFITNKYQSKKSIESNPGNTNINANNLIG